MAAVLQQLESDDAELRTRLESEMSTETRLEQLYAAFGRDRVEDALIGLRLQKAGWDDAVDCRDVMLGSNSLPKLQARMKGTTLLLHGSPHSLVAVDVRDLLHVSGSLTGLFTFKTSRGTTHRWRGQRRYKGVERVRANTGTDAPSVNWGIRTNGYFHGGVLATTPVGAIEQSLEEQVRGEAVEAASPAQDVEAANEEVVFVKERTLEERNTELLKDAVDLE